MMSRIEMIVTSRVSFGLARAQARLLLGSGEGVGDLFHGAALESVLAAGAAE
jgi:hypothetical protein